jgi:photosystem II stability/assembly factor-like uncharacterized protein
MDVGGHWKAIYYALALDAANPANLYCGVGDSVWTAGFPAGVIRSADGGDTWKATALQGQPVTVLAIDPADPNVLYAGAWTNTDLDGFDGLYKSTNGGASWRAINNGLASLTELGAAVTALLVDPMNSSVVYAGTSGDGVYVTADGGRRLDPRQRRSDEFGCPVSGR